MLGGNIGEWSEIYVLFKLLSDKQLQLGDKDLNAIPSMLFPILKIIKDQADKKLEFSLSDDTNIVLHYSGNNISIPIEAFNENASYLLEQLMTTEDYRKGLPKIQEFLDLLNITSLKAKSSQKTDIIIQLHDRFTGTQPVLGFSIKSQLGGRSTLLNASQATNFVFRFASHNFNSSNIELVNNIVGAGKIRKRLATALESNSEIEFVRVDNSTFQNNLILIDCCLHEILAEMLLLYYKDGISKVTDNLDKLTKINPLKLDLTEKHPFYEYKIKRFLTEVALGMTPTHIWEGTLDATGGYIIVKEDGEIVSYHVYKRNEFEDYLLQNTSFETASSSRNQFGKLYLEGAEAGIKLNLQIRFNK